MSKNSWVQFEKVKEDEEKSLTSIETLLDSNSQTELNWLIYAEPEYCSHNYTELILLWRSWTELVWVAPGSPGFLDGTMERIK